MVIPLLLPTRRIQPRQLPVQRTPRRLIQPPPQRLQPRHEHTCPRVAHLRPAACVLWSLGAVAGLEVDGAPFFVAEPANNGWDSPAHLGMPSARVEVFCDDPDAVIARALAAGADGSRDAIRDHATAWGTHRQGGFVDPFGHIWLIGDRSPLQPFP